MLRADTPAPVVEKLSQALQTVMAGRESRDHLARQGWQPMGLDASGMQRFIAAESRRYDSVARTAQIQPE